MLNRIDQPVKTYRELWMACIRMSDEQLDSNITVHDGAEDEMRPAELRIINGEVDNRLDDNHPVIYVP